MADQIAPKGGQQISPDGEVTYEFEGTIKADGIVMPAAVLGEPVETQIRWERESDGGLVARISASSHGTFNTVTARADGDAVQGSAYVEARATDFNGKSAKLYTYASGASRIWCELSGTGGFLTRTLARDDGSSGDDGWNTLFLANGWTNYGVSPWATSSYKIDGAGNVWVRGAIQGGTTTLGTVITTLPSRARPSARQRFSTGVTVSSTAPALLDVDPNGQITVVRASASFTNLDGICFPLQ